MVRECKLPVVGYKIGCASKESQALVSAAGAVRGAHLRGPPASTRRPKFPCVISSPR